jgi:tetratricopeptide (TPR) repeat protein
MKKKKSRALYCEHTGYVTQRNPKPPWLKKNKGFISSPSRSDIIGITRLILAMIGIIIAITDFTINKGLIQGGAEGQVPAGKQDDFNPPNFGIGGGGRPPLVKIQYDQKVNDHNSKAKNILDKTASMHDRDIMALLEQALNELYVSLSFNDRFGETYYFIAYTFLKMGDHYSSFNNISEAIYAYKDSLHHFEKAEQFFYDHYANIFYDRGRAYSALGGIYQSNNTDHAEDYFLYAINSFKFCLEHYYVYPENALLGIADIFYRTGSYQDAIYYYTEALKSNYRNRPIENDILSRRSNAHYELGVLYSHNGEYQRATQCYKDSIRDNPENYAAQYELGKIYVFLKMWAESIEQFDLVIERCPNKIYQDLARTDRIFANSML